MHSQPTSRLSAAANIRFAGGVGVGLIVLGLLVLVGWMFDLGALKSVVPDRPTMKVNTALGVALLGATLLLRARGARRTGQWCAAALTALALAHLWEHLTGVDLGIDQLFVTEALADGGGRMALITSLALAALGVGLALDRTTFPRAATVSDGCAVFAALLALGGFAGHLYGFYPLRSLGPGVATIALHTSVALLIAAAAALALDPTSPLARAVLADRAGGRFARIVLPVALLLPLAAGGLRVVAHELGWFGMELGVLWMVLASIVGFGGATLIAAAKLNAADDRLLATNAALERTVAERTVQLQTAVGHLESHAAFTRGVLDSLSAGVAVLDAAGTVVEVNAQWREVARAAGAATGAELVGGNYLAACERAIGGPGDQGAATALAGIRAVMRGERTLYTLDYPCDEPDGSRYWYLLRVTALAHRPGWVVVSHQDVTDLHHAERALRDRETSYRSMFETNPHPMFVYDPVALTMLAVNAAAVHRYGWTREEFLALRLTDLHPPEEIDRVEAKVPSLAPGFATGIAWTHRTRDGERIEVEVSSHGVTFEGRPGRLVLVHEVTERNRIERELRSKNTELERFTYTVSHDLKSPLVTVRTFAGYLAEDLAAGDTAKVTSDLGYITHAADRMGQMLDELLELSRVGRTRNPPVHTSFREIAEEALRLAAGAVSRAGARVEVDASDVPLYGDRTRLTEIWQNLVDNAAKFMGTQSHPHIRVGVREAGGETEFFVRDNGIGVDKRHAERIFGLFDKLDTRSDGTGVGLALVRRIVELYGGRIGVESDGPGHGSCFVFTLPDARRPAP